MIDLLSFCMETDSHGVKVEEKRKHDDKKIKTKFKSKEAKNRQ